MKKNKISPLGQKIGQRYSSYAKKFDKLFWNDRTDDIFILKFQKYIQKNGRVLDIGCGMGKDTKIFEDNGFVVTGIDTSEEMLKIARRKNPSATFQLMDVNNLEFANNSYDAVFSLYVFDHFPTEMFDTAIKEVYRVLKPSAPFMLILHEGNFEGERIDLMEPSNTLFRNFKPRNWIENELKKNNFKIIFSQSRQFPDIGIGVSTASQSVVIAKKK